MGKIRCYSVLLLCVYLWFPGCQTDCPYQECYCSGSDILCSYLHLQEFPHLVSVSGNMQWSLSIDGNNISRIPVGSLPPNVTSINVNYNPLTSIDDNAFDESASTLTTLYLARVLFTRFPDAFGHLLALASLSINTANITDWNDNVWNGIGKTLHTIELTYVEITVWTSWIRHCTQLSDLTITWGDIASIPDGAFDSVSHSLTSLSLNNNKLTMVPKALSNLNSLQFLYLHNNLITDVKWLPQSNKLDLLSLSYNHIWNASQLSEVLLPYTTSLHLLYIDNNHLTSIPNISFLLTVGDLDFTHNRISDSISGAVPFDVFVLDLSYNSFPFVPKFLSTLLMLKAISLSYNTISGIRETDFHKDAASIDLGSNLITEIEETSFPANFGILNLVLNNNPLTTISPVALQNLPSLRYLNLIHTNLKRLPLGLSYLRSLVSLDVTNSPFLVCTCMESSLASWIVSLSSLNVRGNCGQTSVYDFFYLLSPSCPSSPGASLPLS